MYSPQQGAGRLRALAPRASEDCDIQDGDVDTSYGGACTSLSLLEDTPLPPLLPTCGWLSPASLACKLSRGRGPYSSRHKSWTRKAAGCPARSWTWDRISAALKTGCVTLGRLHNLSELQVLHLQRRIMTSA